MIIATLLNNFNPSCSENSSPTRGHTPFTKAHAIADKHILGKLHATLNPALRTSRYQQTMIDHTTVTYWNSLPVSITVQQPWWNLQWSYICTQFSFFYRTDTDDDLNDRKPWVVIFHRIFLHKIIWNLSRPVHHSSHYRYWRNIRSIPNWLKFFHFPQYQ